MLMYLNIELHLEEQIFQMLKEVERLTSEVGRNYDEYYIRQQINTINRLCSQLRKDGKRTCDGIHRSTKSAQYALSHNKQMEHLLCKQMKEIVVYS